MKRALITGGRGDLAGALTRRLIEKGYQVLAPGRERLDVREENSVHEFFAAEESFDLLINNAGVCDDDLAGRLALESWDKVLAVNLRGAFLCSRSALRGMTKRRSGHIINVGSFSGVAGCAGQSNYAAAKAGLIGLTQSIAREYGGRNIRANCVLPGWIETRMTARISEKRKRQVLAEHVLGRFNTVEDAARFIVQLESFEHISGQVFQLDSRVRRWG